MTDKQLVSLKGEQAKRLHLYGGFVDLVDGLGGSYDLDISLKFAALFYKHIIVTDGFFHCYGPLFDHFSTLVHADRAKQRADTVSRLLEAGIIVPALRRGQSLFENWRNGSDIGIVPGVFLNLRTNDGEEVLRYVDEIATAYTNWPDNMANANIAEFGQILFDVLNEKSTSVYSLRVPTLPREPNVILQSEWREVANFVNKFLQLLHDKKDNTRFRRGDIETFVAQQLNVPIVSDDGTSQVYDLVRQRVNWSNLFQTPKPMLAQHLLSVSTTVYEVYQANQFNTVAGLFRSHDEPLIEEGLYDRVVPLEEVTKRELSPELVVFGSLDVSRLTAKDIITFRSEPSGVKPGVTVFDYYCELASKTVTPQPRQSYLEANAEFCHYLTTEYVPRILTKYPQAGSVVKGLGVVGAGGGAVAGASKLIEVVSGNNTWSILVNQYPILTYVAAVGGALGIVGSGTYVIDQLASYTRRKVNRRRFNRMNQYYWRRRR